MKGILSRASKTQSDNSLRWKHGRFSPWEKSVGNLPFCRRTSITKHMVPTIEKITTEETRSLVSTVNLESLARWYMALMTQGRPKPRNTFTLLLPARQHQGGHQSGESSAKAISLSQIIGLPVIFPIAASAPSSCNAAVLLAKVSGKLVPSATIVIPATLALSPITQPSKLPSCTKTKNHKRCYTIKDTKQQLGKTLPGDSTALY